MRCEHETKNSACCVILKLEIGVRFQNVFLIRSIARRQDKLGMYISTWKIALRGALSFM
jgi:hypothetical protein